MDLSTVTEVLVARHRDDLTHPRPGDAFLAGGTALFGGSLSVRHFGSDLVREVVVGEASEQPVQQPVLGFRLTGRCVGQQTRSGLCAPGGIARRSSHLGFPMWFVLR